MSKEKLSEIVPVRLSSSEADAVKFLAQSEQRPVSVWMRQRLLEVLAEIADRRSEAVTQ